ncbi:D-alanine-D-alanine ligase [Geoalkalibacter ferrihydriticus]|uniref:D-alanine--D-alanine ligase n=2 Tax=Geoalkalibacter ferrihydriticus TaxID=392333 RepID=A0A0C2HKD5_9BACT|nr:D-alanine--D-alanine ligase [Geoalkalibacter ferrihydriticus]KIH75485.1 hypothetical protein GFER_16145 [Geoalkalibacter ferrihydriticus DSM 17813]SDM83942.1 D-alanine-D-alanine ligase [Geoalkalibacter ferrihydriticus]
MNGAKKIKKVLVLCGGNSSERSVSLVSGKACADALRRLGYEVSVVDTDDMRDAVQQILSIAPDVVFNALHGRQGEDGCVQGFLNLVGLPYTHSGVMASAVAMDKVATKQLLAGVGVPSPGGITCTLSALREKELMARPYVVKPVCDGSSKGVVIVQSGEDLDALFGDADLAQEVLVEEFIAGHELTVGVMEGKAFAVTELKPESGWYDFEAKYTAGKTLHLLPASLPPVVYQAALRHAEQAHAVLGCRGISRSDFRYDPARENDENHGLYFLEINTQPGMTELSLAPEQAIYCGYTFDTFVDRLVQLAQVD